MTDETSSSVCSLPDKPGSWWLACPPEEDVAVTVVADDDDVLWIDWDNDMDLRDRVDDETVRDRWRGRCITPAELAAERSRHAEVQRAWERSEQKNAEHRHGWTHLALRLLDAGYRGGGVTDGVEWLLARVKQMTDAVRAEREHCIRMRDEAYVGAPHTPQGAYHDMIGRLAGVLAIGRGEATKSSARPLHLTWNGTEYVDDRCGCRYHPNDDSGSHGGAPHVHRCERHSIAPRLRRCEVCRGPGPCLWVPLGSDRSSGKYACVRCHPEPSDPFFTPTKQDGPRPPVMRDAIRTALKGVEGVTHADVEFHHDPDRKRDGTAYVIGGRWQDVRNAIDRVTTMSIGLEHADDDTPPENVEEFRKYIAHRMSSFGASPPALKGDRREDFEIIENYLAPGARPGDRPRTVIRVGESFLRHSKGPSQGHFPDVYGDDYMHRALAEEAIELYLSMGGRAGAIERQRRSEARAREACRPTYVDEGDWAWCIVCRGVQRGRCMCLMLQDGIDTSRCRAHRGHGHVARCTCSRSAEPGHAHEGTR